MKSLWDKRVVTFFLILLVLQILQSPLVLSAPPVTTVQQFQDGYVISDTPQTLLEQNEDFKYNFFLYNLSNGMLLTGGEIDCFYYLSNSKGEIIYYDEVPYLGGYWSLNISGNNFSEVGYYSYGTRCNSTTLGGEMTGEWVVTPDGDLPTTGRSVIYFSLLFILFALFTLGVFGIITFEHISLKYLFFFSSYLLFMSITFIAWNLSIDYLTNAPFLIAFFRILWWVSIAGLFPSILIGTFYTIWVMVQMKEIQNMINKGIPSDEAYERTVRSGMRSFKRKPKW